MSDQDRYIVEDSKTGRVLYKGTEEQVDAWYEIHKEEYTDKILIFRKELRK